MGDNWVDEYCKLMFPIDGSKCKIEEAKTLKFSHIPDHLYKFRKIDKYSLQNLINDTIWLETPSNYNDPYDCMINVNNTADFRDRYLRRISHEGKIKISSEEMAKLQELNFMEIVSYLLQKDPNTQAQQANSVALYANNFVKEESHKIIDLLNNKTQNSILICSFSSKNTSILMWSHYAENHRGFCLEYNFKELGVEDILNCALQPVIYQDKLLDIDRYILKSIDDIKTFNNLISVLFAMIKAEGWKYEDEWRMVLPLGSSYKPFNRTVPKPAAIYLGSKISSDDEEMLLKIAKWKNIPSFRMKLDNTSFRMLKEPIK